MSNSEQKQLQEMWDKLPPKKQQMAWLTIWPLLAENHTMPPPPRLSELVKHGILSSDEQAFIFNLWREIGITAE